MWCSKRARPRVRDELQFHRDQLIEHYVAAGTDRTEAERRAFLDFGNVVGIEEAVRDVRGRRLADLTQDVRYALRTLRRNPGFAAVAVLSLVLAMGANTAVFSVVNAVLLRPLPVHEPDRLVQITRVSPDGRPANVSYPLFEHFRDNVQSISSAFAHTTASESIAIDGEDDFVTVDLVSGDYFAVLGLNPAAGRLLGPADDALSASLSAAVISDGYWQRRFGRSPLAIGRTFAIRNRVFTIVGVTPSSFRSARVGSNPDITLPLLLMMNEGQRREATSNFLKLVARLKPGASVEQANAEAEVLWGAFVTPLAAQVPESRRAELLAWQARAFPAADGINPFRDDLAQPLLVLMGIVALILMLACLNLSGLLLARAAARAREISIRLAIGAGRGRLIRQFLTETLVLVVIGGAAGLATAGWLSARLVTMFVNGRNLELSVAPDWRVFAFTAVAAVVACCLAGLVPAMGAVRLNVNPALKTMGTHGRCRLGKALVVVQLAISMVLVVGATLFVGTLAKLYAVDRGFDSDGLLVVSVRSTRPYSADRALGVHGALLARLRTLPGVRAASAAQVVPISGNDWTRSVQVHGDAVVSRESTTAFNAIAPDYFATLGTPVLAGREFNERDTSGTPLVAIVNDAFAQYFFGHRSVLGRRVTSLDVTYEIVGVVSNSKYEDLREAARRTLYIAGMQREAEPPSRYTYLVRAGAGDPRHLVLSVEHAVRDADADLRMRTAMTYATLIDRSIPAERILGMLGGLFGLVALVVAGIGLFGLLAFQVARRTSEFGVRIALGATRWSMIRLVLSDVVWMFVPGVAIGVGLALMVTGFARGMLFGLAPTEPGVFVVAASVLACAAILAAWWPVRRASRVDPLVALRHE
ncbi:MAG TPA: ABC transporter permease [Vicinamibacterales bacterium]|nr:ABC transporter permease [Vicinamibacterales bacterium]